ncbi:hypothetical protein Q3G72_011649 [Acer saccharum]|nr:hypothetical protein Q3G72_011649 [Acer saccharum]
MSIGEDWDSSYRVDLGGNRTSVEVVKENLMCDVKEELEETEKVWEMSWNSKDNEDKWLSKCAIGVLKEFVNISSVNHRLCSRGLSFSSKYMGDKRILWIFDSEVERDGFVQSQFLWDDKFNSMVKGSDPTTHHSRLVWINCEGVPLKFWKAEFFKKLGWLLGEPVLIEQETLHKETFDRGRILVLIPLYQPCHGLIKVSVGDGKFFVKIFEDAAPVDPAWTERFLGLSRVPSQAVWSPLLFLERDGSPIAVDQVEKALGRRNVSGHKGCSGITMLKGLDHQPKHCFVDDKDMR